MLSTDGDSDRCFATFYFFILIKVIQLPLVGKLKKFSLRRVHAKPLNKGNKTAFYNQKTAFFTSENGVLQPENGVLHIRKRRFSIMYDFD